MNKILISIIGGLSLLTSSIIAEASTTDIDCLAKVIYHEARGESKKGQMAVGMVVINRAKSGKFSKSICGVIRQPKQFSWYARNPKIKDIESHRRSKELARSLYHTYHIGNKIPRGMDSLRNALFFKSSGSFGSKKIAQVSKVGQHRFYAMR